MNGIEFSIFFKNFIRSTMASLRWRNHIKRQCRSLTQLRMPRLTTINSSHSLAKDHPSICFRFHLRPGLLRTSRCLLQCAANHRTYSNGQHVCIHCRNEFDCLRSAVGQTTQGGIGMPICSLGSDPVGSHSKPFLFDDKKRKNSSGNCFRKRSTRPLSRRFIHLLSHS